MLHESKLHLTRRQWLGGAAAVGAGAALFELPLSAQGPEAWPNVARLVGLLRAQPEGSSLYVIFDASHEAKQRLVRARRRPRGVPGGSDATSIMWLE